MTILESLQSLNTFPIPDSFIIKTCLDRELEQGGEYTSVVGVSQQYELVTADILIWLSNAPSIVEQEIGVNNAISIKNDMRKEANRIYGKYDDSKFSGGVYGFIGDSYNG
jgi:hypothetical protein